MMKLKEGGQVWKNTGPTLSTWGSARFTMTKAPASLSMRRKEYGTISAVAGVVTIKLSLKSGEPVERENRVWLPGMVYREGPGDPLRPTVLYWEMHAGYGNPTVVNTVVNDMVNEEVNND